MQRMRAFLCKSEKAENPRKKAIFCPVRVVFRIDAKE